MSETTAETTATETTASTTAPETPKPTETVEFWKQKARDQEKRAKENAEAAKRLAEIEESQKSEAEKSADRIKQLEGDVPAARLAAFREAAVKFGGITQEDADLYLTASDMETLAKQAVGLARRSDDRKKQGNRVPTEGKTTTSAGEDPMRGFTRSLFGRED
jgi:hypothetical protein